MLRREWPVARFVLLVLLFVALALFGIKGVVDHLSERSRREAELRANTQIAAEQLAASLVLPVWNFDQPQLEKITESVMHNHEVAGVIIRIKDASAVNGARVYGLMRALEGAATRVDAEHAAEPAGMVVEERLIIADGESVGSVKVFSTPRFINDDMRNHLIYAVATFIIFGSILVIGMYILLWRTVLRPLRLLEQYAGEVSSGGVGRLPGGKFRGELEKLRVSLEKMVDLLAARFKVVESSERQFRCFIEQAPVPIFLLPSPDGGAIYFNPAFTRVFGYGRGEIKGPEDWWEHAYPDPAYRAARRAAWEKTIGKVRETGDFQDADEGEMTTKTGEPRFAQVRLAMVEQYRMIFFNDVTERRRAETALRLTQYGVDHSPVMIFRIDMEGLFVYANETACARLGYSRAELLHLHIWDIAMTIAQERWPLRAQEVREKQVLSLETVYTSKSGKDFPVEARAQYVDFSGERQFFVHADDITERRQAQDAVHSYTRRIEKLAKELTHSEERQRRELAAILHDEVGQNLFAATTHLLTLRTRPGCPHEEVGKAIELLDQVTRDTRELTFELCPPVLYQLGLMPALQRLAEQYTTRHGIAFMVRGTTPGPEDLNLRGLAYHAVRELMNNAAKHSGAKQVTVSAAEIGGQVQIEVVDDGVGFDPARLRPGVGGFGLFQLRERIELLGGTLKIDAAPGSGCRVQLDLPLNMMQTVE